ncbi:MAG: hypothetical protein WBP60_06385 [Gammaproteobacteria bacterium]
MSRAPTRLRKRRRTVISTIAMFVVVWLNMALQPCLMAAGPILPQGHEHGDCPHCPDAALLQVDGGECSYFDDFDFDGRDPKTPDASLVVPMPVADWRMPAAPRTLDIPAPSTTVLVRDGPPLHLRHCVFLN